MPFNFPKPRRPFTSASQSVGNDMTVSWYWEQTGQQTNQFKQENPVTSTVCRRTFGTGYPGLPIGPGSKFKLPSDYAIIAKQSRKLSGSALFIDTRFEHPVRRYVGTSEWSPTDISPQMSPYFSAMNFVGMSSQTRIRLGTEVMLKVGNKRASFGEALAESHKTIHHLIGTVIDLAEALHAARKGNWRAVAKHLGVRPRDFTKGHATSKRWLEYQYAWKPLMMDIHDTIELVKKGFREKAQIASSVRNLKDSHHWSEPMSSGFRNCTSSVKYTAKVYYKINDSSLSKLGQIGCINPLSVAWELVPFSFVVDWFVPVGNTLEALTARLGVDFIAGYYGMRAEALFRQNAPYGGIAFTRLDHDTRIDETEMFGYTRETMKGFPVPGFYYKSPFSSTRALSALALISQLTKR